MTHRLQNDVHISAYSHKRYSASQDMWWINDLWRLQPRTSHVLRNGPHCHLDLADSHPSCLRDALHPAHGDAPPHQVLLQKLPRSRRHVAHSDNTGHSRWEVTRTRETPPWGHVLHWVVWICFQNAGHQFYHIRAAHSPLWSLHDLDTHFKQYKRLLWLKQCQSFQIHFLEMATLLTPYFRRS